MKVKAIARQLVSFVLPVTALILVPLAIENDFAPRGIVALLEGGFLMLTGLCAMVLTIRMFILIGRGTLAPWSPTQKLVVRSLYAHVRNPMILGVLTVLVGESILFSSWAIGIWAVCFFLINTIYFILSEEPGLEKRFGAEYREYKQNVPRWIPRARAWQPPA